jgi:hypothetical protein
MICQLTNFNTASTNSLPFVGEASLNARTSDGSSLSGCPIFSVETFARMELSLIPEVERIYFDREADNEFRIISVVNKRDAGIRDKVYAREEEIMNAYPGLNFDFHVMARMDRKIEDVITKAGKVIFER